MIISRIEIHGFRSLYDLQLDLKKYSVLVGKNNSGKSNLLAAIYSFYNPSSISLEDASKNEKNEYIFDEISIKLIYTNLTDDEKRENNKYFHNNKLIVELIAQIKDDEGEVLKRIKPIHYGYTPKKKYEISHSISGVIKEYYTLEKPPKRSNLEKEPTFYECVEEISPSGRVTIDDWSSILETFALKSPKISITEEIQRDNSKYQGFIGTSNEKISGKCIFIPALQDPSTDFDDSKKTSLISKLMENLMNDCISDSTKSKFSDILDDLNGDREETRQKIENRFKEELNIWNTTANLQLFKPELSKVIPLEYSLNFNDGILTEVEKKGTGLQRYIYFKFLKIFNELTHTDSISFFFLFEEPESHLHPHFQREIAEIIETIISKTKYSYQVMISTHSAQFINIQQLENVYRFSRDDVNFCTISEDCILNFSDIKEELNISYLFNPYIREIFFADKVILVEGASELILFQYLKSLGISIPPSISILEMGSKQNYRYFLPVLKAAKIPFCILVDEDPYWEPYYKIKNPDSFKSKKRDYHSTMNIVEKTEEISGKVIVLRPDLDSLLNTSKNQLKKSKVVGNFLQLEDIFNSSDPEKIKLQSKIKSLGDLIINFEDITETSIVFPTKDEFQIVDPQKVKITSINSDYIAKKLVAKIKLWKSEIEKINNIDEINKIIKSLKNNIMNYFPKQKKTKEIQKKLQLHPKKRN